MGRLANERTLAADPGGTWLPPFDGGYPYCPSRPQLPPEPRALTDFRRERPEHRPEGDQR